MELLLVNTVANTGALLAHSDCLAVETKKLKAQFAFYKEYRKVSQPGIWSRHSPGWQVSDGTITIADVFHELVHAAPSYE